jgi:hypothetical protein
MKGGEMGRECSTHLNNAYSILWEIQKEGDN